MVIPVLFPPAVVASLPDRPDSWDAYARVASSHALTDATYKLVALRVSSPLTSSSWVASYSPELFTLGRLVTLLLAALLKWPSNQWETHASWHLRELARKESSAVDCPDDCSLGELTACGHAVQPGDPGSAPPETPGVGTALLSCCGPCLVFLAVAF